MYVRVLHTEHVHTRVHVGCARSGQVPHVTRTWKVDPLYPNPASPVQSCRKFSAVLGTASPYKPIVIRPSGAPPISISIKTFFVTASGLCTAPAAAAMHLAPPLTSPTRRHSGRTAAGVPRTLRNTARVVIIAIAYRYHHTSWIVT